MKFKPYSGDLIGLPTNENHLNFRWTEPDCKVLFSITRHGNGASCHVASDKSGMKKINNAIKSFCEFVFKTFEWCRMIISIIRIKKIRKIVRDCGFAWILSNRKQAVYIRRREWVIS